MMEQPQLEIGWEWEPAPNVKAPELKATWASIEMYVGQRCLTLVEDVESGSSRRSIYCPLYPLAEWIAYNWWFLKAHSRPSSILSRLGPGAKPSPDTRLWRQRHNIRSAGDGFRWPNLCILPDGETTRLVWQADEPGPQDQVIRFLTSGEVSIASDLLQQRLISFVTDVIARLAQEGVRNTPLEPEWSALQNTDSEEVPFCLAAARLGLDPYSEVEKYQGDILRAAGELDRQLFDDFMDAVQPEQIGTALSWVAEAQREIHQLTGTDGDEIRALRSRLGSNPGWARLRPWEQGWRQARAVREALGLDLEDPFEPQAIVQALTRPAPPRGLQALGGGKPNAPARVVVGNHQLDNARRFTLTRALWHLLWQGTAPFLITNAYTDRQKVERAFAAELLAPADGIARQLSADPLAVGVEDREIEDLARRYQVSPMLVQHQLDNQILRSL